ncbi:MULTISPECIES: TIGR02530 family flagellar biosynthesis protein [Lysinibacillus]|uniref:TIGR02530 family flagellar biosynthesis protein n=1 Tax=Lysinibacillus TaxID=400634 RepID=UPI00104558E8|nr:MULTISPECIES: TIGR02530 family flagellar biosynthesis protein [Lysinibacillus]MDD1501234.1 flagellar protein [Lysinibacillus sp. CNPSo 3705]MEB2278535.1 flagellar protein [Lysinibacillus xylanilyticus]UPW85331.1 flagellar protein [Lysinibacillus sp. Ag94]
MDKFSIHRVPLHPSIRQTQPKPINAQQSFKAHLQEATNQQELKVSKHAHERIMERKIAISEQEWQAVSDKVFEAHSKGVKQPLVLMDQAALIVSAKNATVITAMDRTEAKQQIFTNIDGTIVL